MIYSPSLGLWVPSAEIPMGYIPPSPSARARERRQRAIVREFTTWRGRCYLPGVDGYLEPMQAMSRIGQPGAMSGGMSGMSGVETQLCGPNVPAITAPTAFWRLLEAADVRYDSANSHDMGETGTIGQAAGKIGDCATYDGGGGNYLMRSSGYDAGIAMGSGVSFHAWAWVYKSGGTNPFIMSSWWDNSSGTEWQLLWGTPSQKIFFGVQRAAGEYTEVNTADALSNSTWYFVEGWLDVADGKPRACVNNGTVAVGATGSYFAYNHGDGAVCIGARNYTGSTLTWNGSIDAAGLLRGGVYTTDERTAIYNSGTGREYYSGAWH